MRGMLIRVLLFVIMILAGVPLRGQDADIMYNITVGDKYKEKGQEDSARVYYAKAYGRFAETLDDESKHLCAMAYLKSAKICYYSDKFPEGLDLYLKGLKIIEECKNKTHISDFYIGMADVYWLNQDLEMAAHCYEKGYLLSVTYKDIPAQLNIANNLTGIYCYLQLHDKAKKYMRIANQLDTDSVTQTYLNLLHRGLMMVNDGQYAGAAALFRESGVLAVKHDLHPKYACSSYEELYKLYMKTSQTDSVKYYLFKCYDILKKKPMVNMLPACLRNLSKIYADEGDFEKAYAFKDRYYVVVDSIFRFRDINRLRNIQTVYEAEKTNNKIVQLQLSHDQKAQVIRWQKMTMLMMALGILILGWGIFYVYRQKQKVTYLYKKLFKVNKAVVDSERYNRELRIRYEEQLRLSSQEQETPAEKAEVPDDRQKYGGSKLSAEQKSALMEAIRDVMDNTLEFCDVDFSLDKLAARVNSNATYVSQVINEACHRKFTVFVNEYRIKEARKRLSDSESYGNYTIKTISESVGFKSQTTFIKMFREFTGMTPSMFQKMTKGKD